jgi:hypothetical protein
MLRESYNNTSINRTDLYSESRHADGVAVNVRQADGRHSQDSQPNGSL